MNYRHILLLLICLVQTIGLTFGQEENIWVFGTGAGLDFNQPNPVAINTQIEGFGEGSASVCNSTGELLFYTDGSVVWNRNHDIMQNGTALTPIPNANNLTPTSSTAQGTLIVQVPGSHSKYYIWSLTSLEQGINAGRLYYSIVDVNADNGMGAVIAGQKGILVDSALLEKMTAVVGDRCNVWLLVCSNSPAFKAFEITSAGVSASPVVSGVGIGNSDPYMVGCMTVSPDRHKLAATRSISGTGAGTDGLILCDFDPGTGLVSNALQLLAASGAYGVCFSPDNTKLYVNVSNGSSNPLNQYDISSGNATTIIGTQTFLGTAGFTQIKLAPNGKVYFRQGYSGSNIGVINYPNLAGAACNYFGYAITLPSGARCGPGLPNVVPAYRQDTSITKQYDSLPCFVGSLLLAASDLAGYGYVWNNGALQPQLQTTNSGTYWVEYFTPPCVFHRDSFTVWIPSGRLPELNTSPTCPEKNNGLAWLVKVPGDSTVYEFIWRNALQDTVSVTDSLLHAAAGAYTVQIISATGCDTILSIVIGSIDHQVAFTADSFACIDNPFLLQNLSHSYFSTFQWDFGDYNTSVLFNPVHVYALPGNYQVRLIGTGSKCSDTAYRSIIVDAPATASFVTDKDSICMGESISFSLLADSTRRIAYWQWGDGTSWEGPGTDSIYYHAYDQEGIMPVTLNVLLRACPDASYTSSVYVSSFPIVILSADSSLCLGGTALPLFNTVSQPDNYRVRWNTGANTDTLIIKHPGSYSLSVTSVTGCTTTESVTINKSCYIDIPNAFTPNGDGTNDYFFPRQTSSKQVSSFRMQVWNRWGQVVFETDKTNGRGWDGNFNNKAQPEGIYLYSITAEINNNQTERYQGNVTLIR